MILLHHNINWSAVSSIATVLAFLAAGIYTLFTYQLLKATSKATQQNAIANELSAYLALRKDLCSTFFLLVTRHARWDTLILEDNPVLNNNNQPEQFLEENGKLKIAKTTLVTEVLNNIEDLFLFYDNKVLSIDTIDSGFGYSILYLGNNSEIKNLIKTMREGQPDLYNGIVELYGLIWNKLGSNQQKDFSANPFS